MSCYYCNEDCNPLSLVCGQCSREMVMKGFKTECKGQAKNIINKYKDICHLENNRIVFSNKLSVICEENMAKLVWNEMETEWTINILPRLDRILKLKKII